MKTDVTADDIKALFGELECGDTLKVEISQLSNCVRIEVSAMYDRPRGLGSFENLRKLAEFMGSDKIDVSDGETESGCDMCGSNYGIVFEVYE